MQSRALAQPELVLNDSTKNFSNGQKLFANERVLKQLPVYSSSQLEKISLVLLYDQKNENLAYSAKNMLINCQRQLNMKA